MEASALAYAGRRGLLGRRSPALRLKGDDRLVAMIREGDAAAFEALFDRYQPRLHAFCRHMLGSHQDAEDVLQEVFVAAHTAMLADRREINVRPWLYRIARNRCLNHLRRPRAGAGDSAELIEALPDSGGASAAERVQTREELRQIFADVSDLPETQRTALLLREIDALSYGEIAVAMDTTVGAVKSLLVRARVSLAEASESRLLTCGEVRLELAEAAEGITRVGGPVRAHVRRCPGCTSFRDALRSNRRELAALAPIGPLAALYHLIVAKLGAGVSGSAAGAGTAGAGASTAGGVACGAGAGAASAGAAATATGLTLSGAAIGGTGAIGGTIAAKAAAGFATAAILTAGAVEVNRIVAPPPSPPAVIASVAAPVAEAANSAPAQQAGPSQGDAHAQAAAPAPSKEPQAEPTPTAPAPAPAETEAAPTPVTTTEPAAPAEPTEEPVADPSAGGDELEPTVIVDPTTEPAPTEPTEPTTDPVAPTDPSTSPTTPTDTTTTPPPPTAPAPTAPAPTEPAPAPTTPPADSGTTVPSPTSVY
jgi:RNA polymerase sigma factor (sigma-70 family)